MGEWSVRVLGPEYQIGAAVECLSGSGWAIEQSGDEFVFRFNRRRTRHAAFRSLLGIAAGHAPLSYNMLISPEAAA